MGAGRAFPPSPIPSLRRQGKTSWKELKPRRQKTPLLQKEIQSLDFQVALSPNVQDLCNRLKKYPSSFSLIKYVESKTQHDDCDVSCGEDMVEQIYDSIFCLLIFDRQSRSCGESCQWLLERLRVDHNREAVERICRNGWKRGQKIERFCQEFLGDRGTVFNLSSKAKDIILLLGIPRKNFQNLHRCLAGRLLKNGILDAAKENQGCKILEEIHSANFGWNILCRDASDHTTPGHHSVTESASHCTVSSCMCTVISPPFSDRVQFEPRTNREGDQNMNTALTTKCLQPSFRREVEDATQETCNPTQSTQIPAPATDGGLQRAPITTQEAYNLHQRAQASAQEAYNLFQRAEVSAHETYVLLERGQASAHKAYLLLQKDQVPAHQAYSPQQETQVCAHETYDPLLIAQFSAHEAYEPLEMAQFSAYDTYDPLQIARFSAQAVYNPLEMAQFAASEALSGVIFPAGG